MGTQSHAGSRAHGQAHSLVGPIAGRVRACRKRKSRECGPGLTGVVVLTPDPVVAWRVLLSLSAGGAVWWCVGPESPCLRSRHPEESGQRRVVVFWLSSRSLSSFISFLQFGTSRGLLLLLRIIILTGPLPSRGILRGKQSAASFVDETFLWPAHFVFPAFLVSRGTSNSI